MTTSNTLIYSRDHDWFRLTFSRKYTVKGGFSCKYHSARKTIELTRFEGREFEKSVLVGWLDGRPIFQFHRSRDHDIQI